MGRRRAKGRQLDGVLILDKPPGMSSNDALQKAKRLLFAAKAGHTGSLDPLATGVLPLCFGEATKFSQFLLDADKRYSTVVRLGSFTTTGDAEGEELERCDTSAISETQVLKAMEQFRGEIDQVPPMYSALKHNGVPLYKLARQGIEVERESRRVTIFDIQLVEFVGGEAATVELDVHCSKGTYIRTIAEDLGKVLECGAHVEVLRRTQSGPFVEADAITLEALDEERGDGLAEQLDHHLLATDAAVSDLPTLELDDQQAYYFSRGNPVMDPQVYRIGSEGGMVRVFAQNSSFLGVGVIDGEGRIAPKRLIAN